MVASRAYRVVSDSARNPAHSRYPGPKHPHPNRKRSAQRGHTFGILIAGFALGSLALGSAVTLFSGDRSFASATPYVASRNALVALADPVAPPVAKRDPRVAIETPSQPAGKPESKPVTVAARQDEPLAVPEPAAPRAAAPVQRQVSTFTNAPTSSTRYSAITSAMSPQQLAAVEAVPFPLARPEPAETAAPSERIALAFATDLVDPETTGSLGNVAQGMGVQDVGAQNPAPDKPTAMAPSPVAARIAAVIPMKPAAPKPARRLTPHEKLWSPVRLASLTPSDTMRDSGSNLASAGLPRAPYDRNTAVYVIGHKRVYMPDGSSLEAHSGLGEHMDNPRFAHLRMRGVTPPHVYDMRMRESLFHGVEAIRLKPIGGEKAIFGRDGLLAHTYMLGPNGQSNGCVSFKDYRAFLNAFKAGKISRLAVIPHLD